MVKHREQRVGVFVDVANMYHSAKNLYSSKVNFKEILKTAIAGRKLVGEHLAGAAKQRRGAGLRHHRHRRDAEPVSLADCVFR